VVTVCIELRGGEVREIPAGVFVWNGSETDMEEIDVKQWTEEKFLESDFYAQFAMGTEEEEERLHLLGKP
jgi:hypothetical protein